MNKTLLILLLLLLPTLTLVAEEAGKPSEPTAEDTAVPQPDPNKPVIKQLDENRYLIGTVTIDKKKREIRFPAKLNMKEGLLEYLIVHENGSVHESLLSTTISPTHLNIAFKLLNYPPSPEHYLIRLKDGSLSDQRPVVDEKTKAAARIRIQLEWTRDNKTLTTPAGQWVQHAVRTTESMPEGPWVYGGSEILGGYYLPETNGEVCAIFATNTALITYPGEGAFDDTVWNVYTERVPEIGTNITVVIAPYPNAPIPAKP